MIGAIAGDIIGSIYEWNNIHSTQFPLFSPGCKFTDDSVLTIALADSILTGTPYTQKLKEYYFLYPGAGYGDFFHQWARAKDMGPYNSFGNGSAMRVSPVAYAYRDLETVLDAAKRSAEVTHNHPEGIKGAQAVAAAIFLGRNGSSKAEIKAHIETGYGYDLSASLDQIRPSYTYNETCQGSVPQAITAFLESSSFEDAIRKVISLGGDSDTLACITGSIAEGFYGGVPGEIASKVYAILDDHLAKVTRQFAEKYF